MSTLRLSTVLLLGATVGGCTNEPQYLVCPTDPVTPCSMTMEAGQDDGTGTNTLVVAKSSTWIPIIPESTKDAEAREALATKLGMDPSQVPYVRVGDLDVSVEYTIKSLDTAPGIALVELNGANSYFIYDPSTIIQPGEDPPPTPGLQGDIPINVLPGAEADGVFTEDQLLEASIDLDQITRGNVNVFTATLTVNMNDPSFQPMSVPQPAPPDEESDDTPPQTPVGNPIPRAAFAQLLRVDLVFKPDHHMVLDYTVRVRDHRDIVDPKGLAAPASEIVTFAPVLYAP